MKHRFRFLAKPQSLVKEEDSIWNLDEQEIHHFSKVLRLKEGVEVEVFDGKGLWACGPVILATSAEVLVKTKAPEQSFPAQPQIALALGVLRTSSVDSVLAELVELGVDQFYLFSQEHSQKKQLTEKTLKRWQKIILVSAKQCKRAFLPQIVFFKDLEQFLEAKRGEFNQRIFLSPNTTTVFEPHRLLQADEDILALIGSESDLSAKEQKILEKFKFKKAQLGALVLRASTATIVSTALLSLWRSKLSK